VAWSIYRAIRAEHRRYAVSMGSVVYDLRREGRARVAAMAPHDRLATQPQFGEQGLGEIMSAHGIDRQAALRLVRSSRRSGRRPSACLDHAR
jgi:hypothetical protein